MAITPWEAPTAGDDAADAPFRERFVDALDNRCRHVKEAVYDDTIHVPHPDRPHDHCGECSPRIYSTAVPNLVTRGLCTKDWTLSGATQSTSTGVSFSGGSQSARRRIMGSAARSMSVFGSGCPLTLAVLLRIVGTVTVATVNFGLGDAGSFATGAKGSVDVGDLTTDFERFYFFLASFSATGHSTDCSVLLTTDASWTGAGTIQATLALLRPGNGLAFWQQAYLETQHKWSRDTQTGPASLYDQVRDFIDATEVTPT